MVSDRELCKLIKQALHYSKVEVGPNTKAEVLALVIDQLSEIKAHLGNWRPYYDAALPMTMRDVKRNIDKFPTMFKLDMQSVNCQNPSEATHVRRCFIHWVLMILKRDCYDVMRQQQKRPLIVSISDLIGGNEGLTIEETIADDLHLTGIEHLQKKEHSSLGKLMRRYIEEDPEEKLRNCHPRGRLNCNCQALSQKILLDNSPMAINKLAIELKIPYQTLLSHWHSKCRPILVELAEKLGY